jgi:hypothetical protein
MRTSLRAGIAALALVLTIAPAAMAETTSSTVNESLSAAASISATLPASVTYTPNTTAGAGFYIAPISATNVSTDHPAGLTVRLTASTLTSASTTIPLTDRQFEHSGAAVGWTRTPVMYGTSSISNTEIATRTTPVSSATLNVDAQVRNVTVPGSYSGSLTFSFTTN